MIIAVLCPPDLVLLVRSGPVIRDLGGSVRIWEDNGPVLISYFYDGAVPVKVFQNRSQSGFIWIMYVQREYIVEPSIIQHNSAYLLA